MRTARPPSSALCQSMSASNGRCPTLSLLLRGPHQWFRLLVDLFSLFEETRDPKYINDILSTMEDATPDLKYAPSASDKGLTAYYNYEGAFNTEDAKKVQEEVQVR